MPKKKIKHKTRAGKVIDFNSKTARDNWIKGHKKGLQNIQELKLDVLARDIKKLPKGKVFIRVMNKDRTVFQDAKRGAIHFTPKDLVLDFMEQRLEELEDRLDRGKRVDLDELEELKHRIRHKDFTNTQDSLIELDQLDFSTLKPSDIRKDQVLNVVEENAVFASQLGEEPFWPVGKNLGNKIILFIGKNDYPEVDGIVVTPTKQLAALNHTQYNSLLSRLRSRQIRKGKKKK